MQLGPMPDATDSHLSVAFETRGFVFSNTRSYALFRKAEKEPLAMIFHGYPLRSRVSGRHSSPPFRDSSPGG